MKAIKGRNYNILWRGKEVSQKAYVNYSWALEGLAVNIWSAARSGHSGSSNDLSNETFTSRTGELEKSISIHKQSSYVTGSVSYSIRAGVGFSDGIRAGSVGAGGSALAFYALYVELGTVKMPAYPFLRPAFNKYRKSAVATIRRIMRSKV